jgi:hypothetical protein
LGSKPRLAKAPPTCSKNGSNLFLRLLSTY